MERLLRIENVTQKFGGLTALNNVNMHVDKGEIVGIIGPNGSGKTTMFNIITGIYRPTEGQVLYQDEPITGMEPYLISRKGLARTFQNIRLFSRMTAFDNVVIGMHARTKTNMCDIVLHLPRKRREEKECEERAMELLKLVDLYDVRYELASSLSYGHQRRLEIARALATGAEILLLDEPAAGMNEQETDELLQIIRRIKELKKTVILIDHDMKFVMNICERLYVLNYGVLIADGTPEEISKNQDVIDAYLGEDDE
ncbi:MAG: ABC transporter ATP-binding protein [Lachnospiraceae bacterium]|nr:ABC transporter ATP-binding protein [Lachnospiraceae bacterium]